MEFRPCIDIHNGKVKQIVGSTLKDMGDSASENFVATQDATFFSNLYQKKNITNGHIILLNRPGSDYYEATKTEALKALRAYPSGMQAGGSITPENAAEYLEAGASHVIVTSYVFKNGQIYFDNLDRLVNTVGKERLVLDLSCRMKNGQYYIVTDRWQKYTDVILNHGTMDMLSSYCDEFLIHAVDVEGKSDGIEKELVRLLGSWNKIPITYAGGIHTFEELRFIKEAGNNQIHATIGSALDLFGGPMKLEEVLQFIQEQ